VEVEVYLALELDLLVVAVGVVPLGQAGLAPDASRVVSQVQLIWQERREAQAREGGERTAGSG